MVIQKATLSKVGVWAFIVGVILALCAGFIDNSMDKFTIPTLVIIGIIVGLLNITDKEASTFLMASVSVMIAVYTAQGSIFADLGTLGFVGSYLTSVLQSINIVVFPATIVVAFKTLYALAKDE